MTPWLRRGGLFLASLLGLLCIGILTLQVDAIGGRVVEGAFTRAPLVTEAEVGGVRGTWLFGLELRDVVVASEGRGHVALASVRVRWSPLPLIRRSVHLRLLELVEPTGQWDSCAPMPQSSDATGTPWGVRIDSVAVLSGRMSGQACLGDGTTGSFEATGFTTGARGITVGEGTRVERFSLSATLRPPATDSTYRAGVALRGAFADGHLVIDTLSVRSPASDVRGRGSLALTRVASEPSELAVQLAPLATRDLHPWASGWLVDDAMVNGGLRVTRSGTETAASGSLAIRDAGRVELEGAWSDAPTRVTYRGEIVARAFDPSRLLAGVPEAVIDGRAEAALEGPTLAAASGHVELEASDSSEPGTTRSAEVVVEVRDGLGEVGAALEWSDIRARIGGTARPFADTPDFDLATEVDAFAVQADTVGPLRIETRLDEGVVLGALRGSIAGGRTDGGFSVELGDEPRLVVDRLSLFDVEPTALEGRISLERVDIGATVRSDGRLEATGVAATSSGRVEAVVAGELRDPAGTITIEDGRLSGIDLGTLGAPTPDSAAWATSLHATFEGRLDRAERLEDWEGVVRVALARSTIGRQEVPDGEVTLTLRDGVARTDGRIGLPEGSVKLAGRAHPFDSLGRVTVDSLVLRGVDVAALSASDAMPTLLDARLTGEGGGAWPSTNATFDFVVDRARVGTADFTSSTVSGRVTGGGVEVEARSTGPWGEAHGHGRARFGGDSATLTADGEFDVRRLSGLLGEGVRPGRARGVFGVDLAGGAEDEPFAPTALAGRARLSLAAGAVADVPFDSARVVADVSQGSVRLDSTSVWSSVGTVEVGGTLPWATGSSGSAELTVRARAGDLTPMASYLGVERIWADSATFEALVTGVRDSLDIRATARADALYLGSLSSLRAVGALDAVIGSDGSPERWTTNLRVRSAEALGVRFDSTDVRVAWDGSEIGLGVESLVDQRRSVRIGGRFDPIGRGGVLEQLDASVDEDRWALQAPATLTLGAAPRVDELVLAAGRQRIELRGGIDPSGVQDASVTVRAFRVESVADLAGWPTIGGTLDGLVELVGPATDPVASLSVDAALTENGGPFGGVHLEARGAGAVLDVDAELTRPDGARVANLAGTVPFSLTLPDSLAEAGVEIPDGPIDLTLRADAFSLEWSAPFIESAAVEAPSGLLVADMRALGTAEAPELSGRLAFMDAGVRLPDVGIELTEGRLEATLTADRIRVDTLRVRSDGGSATASGDVTLENLLEPRLALNARLEDFAAVRNDLAEATLSGDLTIGGTPFAPEIGGALEVRSAEVNLDAELASADVARVELTEDDVRMLEATFGFAVEEETRGPGLYEASDLRLDLAIGRDTWVRQRSNPEMALQFTGDLSVDKRPERPPEVTGTLTTIAGRSYISQFGRRFQVASGEVDFPGPLTEANVDVTATYTVPSMDNAGAAGVVITLAASGTADELSLTLSSDPAMDNADIVSYIATGRPAAQGFGSAAGQTSLLGAGAAVASDQLVGLLQRTAMDVVGVEVLEIDSDGIVAGWFLSPRLYVGFTQPLFSGSSEVTSTEEQTRAFEVEYEAYRWLVLNVQRGGSRIGFFLKSRYAY